MNTCILIYIYMLQEYIYIYIHIYIYIYILANLGSNWGRGPPNWAPSQFHWLYVILWFLLKLLLPVSWLAALWLGPESHTKNADQKILEYLIWVSMHFSMLSYQAPPPPPPTDSGDSRDIHALSNDVLGYLWRGYPWTSMQSTPIHGNPWTSMDRCMHEDWHIDWIGPHWSYYGPLRGHGFDKGMICGSHPHAGRPASLLS